MNKRIISRIVSFAIANLLFLASSSSWADVVAHATRVSILGDSYSTWDEAVPTGHASYYKHDVVKCGVSSRSQLYWQRFIDIIGGQLEVCEAWSGSFVSYTTTNGTTPMCDESRLTNLGDPDVILFLGGTNDSWNNANRGADFDCYSAETWVSPYISMFRPAYSYILNRLKTLYPAARIICLINDNNSNNKPGMGSNYSADSKEIAEHYGVEWVSIKNFDCDDWHPTMDGHRVICEQLLAQYWAIDNATGSEVSSVSGTSSVQAGKVLSGTRTSAEWGYSYQLKDGTKFYQIVAATNASKVAVWPVSTGTTVEYFAVGGGGAGGINGLGNATGGGGAGGVVEGFVSVTSDIDIRLVVGRGGAGVAGNVTGDNGCNTYIRMGSTTTKVALGGGGGASNTSAAKAGGSGGGGGGTGEGTSGGAALQPSSTSGGFGNAGGLGYSSGTNYGGGGGGGAGSAGTAATSAIAGCGGDAVIRYITGFKQAYAGGGASWKKAAAKQGTGGAADDITVGGRLYDTDPTVVSYDFVDGVANTGSGGASLTNGKDVSGAGGSGIAVIRYEIAAPAEYEFEDGSEIPSQDDPVTPVVDPDPIVNPLQNGDIEDIGGEPTMTAATVVQRSQKESVWGVSYEVYDSAANQRYQIVKVTNTVEAVISVPVSTNVEMLVIGGGSSGGTSTYGASRGPGGNAGSLVWKRYRFNAEKDLTITVGAGSTAHDVAGDTTTVAVGGSALIDAAGGAAAGCNTTGKNIGGNGGNGAGGNGAVITTGSTGGAGGAGLTYFITGDEVAYAGGGGGAVGGAGAAGGGKGFADGAAGNALPNTGSGGGGGLSDTATIAGGRVGYGGSGIVILRWPIEGGAPEPDYVDKTATSTETSTTAVEVPGSRIDHDWGSEYVVSNETAKTSYKVVVVKTTSTTQISVPVKTDIEMLLVGGGSAGGSASQANRGNGGNAGSVTWKCFYFNIESPLSINVGAGGTASEQPGNKSTVQFEGETLAEAAGGVATVKNSAGSSHGGNGGTGAGGAGESYSGQKNGGNGGPGVTKYITGTATAYAGGGGGALAGLGQAGGGNGYGVTTSSAATSASANTGSGGGAGSTPGAGGSGIVVLRWKLATDPKIIDDDGKEITVTVPDQWLTEKGLTKSDLGKNGANGIPVWKSYVLCLDPNDPASRTVVRPVQTSDSDTLTINLGTLVPRTDAGVDVTYQLGTKDSSGGAFVYGEEQTSHTFNESLSGLTGVRYFSIRAKLVKPTTP